MVGDHPVAHARLPLVGPAAHPGHFLDDGEESVRAVEVLHVLEDGRHPVEAHARVNVLLGQGLEDPGPGDGALAVVLGEDQVPDLHEPVPAPRVGAGLVRGAVGRAPVVEDLRAGTRRPVRPVGDGPARPVVLVLAEAADSLLGDPHEVAPDLVGLVVVLKDRDPEAPGVKLEVLGEELPGPEDGLLLEVVPEGEVAQHLKVGVVPAGAAHVLYVPHPQALLAGGDPAPLPTPEDGLRPQEVRL